MSSITDSILGPDSSFPSDLEMPEVFSSGSNDSSSTAEISDYNVSDSGDGIMGYFASLTGTTWFLIILLLGFLGFNVFVYLAKGTNLITDALQPIVERVSRIFVGLTSQITDVSAEGAKEVIDTSASVSTTGLTTVQNVTPGGPPSSEPSSTVSKTKSTAQDIKTTFPTGDVAQANALNKAINSSTAQRQQQNGEDYQADDSSSSIQKGTSKAGFCYIGEDRGFRTCEEVGVNDTCMSGDIFPTRDVCVNPTLRA